ncbi:MAG: hypothetical protein EOL90_13025, partial [Spartobacteria bacterium]|nr:hypothetical protein [Spartobacteria bacterium]
MESNEFLSIPRHSAAPSFPIKATGTPNEEKWLKMGCLEPGRPRPEAFWPETSINFEKSDLFQQENRKIAGKQDFWAKNAPDEVPPQADRLSGAPKAGKWRINRAGRSLPLQKSIKIGFF